MYVASSIVNPKYGSEFEQNYLNVAFLQPLVMSMTQKDPSKRPSAADAERQWRKIRGGISSLDLSWRLRAREELWIETAVLSAWHVGKSIFSWVTDTQG
jgi:hypothetical protein